MSWQSYVDDHLMCGVDGVHLNAAATIGLDGGVWAQSATFPQVHEYGLIKLQRLGNMLLEIANIVKDFDEPGFLAPTGLFLGGARYKVIQGEPGTVVRGKKGSGGITIEKTGQALIFSIYEEPMTPGQCNLVVEKMGDYLIDQGL